MKNSKKLVKTISFILVSVMVLTLIMSLPAFAETDYSVPQIQVNEGFNPNDVIKAIVNILAIIIFLIGIIVGLIKIAIGKSLDDNKEMISGFIVIVVLTIISGSMLTIVNMVLK